MLPDEWQVTGSARLGKRVRRAIMDADEITGFADATADATVESRLPPGRQV